MRRNPAPPPHPVCLTLFSSGKQIVYFAIQNPNDNITLDDLAAMDQEITSLHEAIATAKVEEKALKAQLVSLQATMSTQDLRGGLAALETEKQEVLARLGPLRAGIVRPVPPKERAAVDQAWKVWNQQANIRKKICLEVWACVTEEMPEGKTKEELWVCIRGVQCL